MAITHEHEEIQVKYINLQQAMDSVLHGQQALLEQERQFLGQGGQGVKDLEGVIAIYRDKALLL